jgi:hypothetical protein
MSVIRIVRACNRIPGEASSALSTGKCLPSSLSESKTETLADIKLFQLQSDSARELRSESMDIEILSRFRECDSSPLSYSTGKEISLGLPVLTKERNCGGARVSVGTDR